MPQTQSKMPHVLVLSIRKGEIANAETAANRIKKQLEGKAKLETIFSHSFEVPEPGCMPRLGEGLKAKETPTRDEHLSGLAQALTRKIETLTDCSIIVDTEAGLLFNTIDALARLVKAQGIANKIKHIFIRVALPSNLAKDLNLKQREVQTISAKNLAKLAKHCNEETDPKTQAQIIAKKDRNIYIHAKGLNITEDQAITNEFCRKALGLISKG